MTPVPAPVPGSRSLLRVPAAVPVSGRAALGALVVALVVGILGMHALSSHGTPAAAPTSVPEASSAHVAAMTAGASHEGHAHAADARPSDQVDAGTGADSRSGHHQPSTVMLCVVMLAAAALTLLVLLVVGPLRPLLPAAFRPAAARARVLQWVRGTGPPHEWQFSVIRC
jgi:hypothetical protein